LDRERVPGRVGLIRGFLLRVTSEGRDFPPSAQDGGRPAAPSPLGGDRGDRERGAGGGDLREEDGGSRARLRGREDRRGPGATTMRPRVRSGPGVSERARGGPRP